MAISSVSSGNPLDQLARALVSKFDANHDGQLTTEEFTSFLNGFLGSSAGALSNGNTIGGLEGTTRANGLKNGTVAPAMRGFNARKLADPNHDTVKYMFGRVAQRYSLESVHDKQSAEALLNSMRDDLKAEGLNVLDVSKDKIKILDNAGQEAWIDVINSASTNHPAWQWLDTRF